MFESFLEAELTKRIGTPVEIAMSDGLVEGIITSVTGNLLTILQRCLVEFESGDLNSEGF